MTCQRILLVDDLADNRNLLAQFLEERYAIAEAANGQEALEAIGRERPDLVLLDLAMPVLDGFAVLEALAAERGSFLPVIVVTAASERESRLRALQWGAHEFLTKPIDPEELLARVQTLLALKEARDQAERRNRALQRALEERTEALERERFQRAEIAQLKEMDRLKDEFLSVVSHELRTPLNFIMGFASILDDELAGRLNSEQHAHMGKIIEGSERMLGLVNDLLEFAKLRSGKFSLEPLPVAYRPLVENVVATMRPLADQKAIALKTRFACEPTAVVDAMRVVQVLTNMLSNAIKFTPEGGSIRLSIREDAGAIVTEVDDTGIGIARENLSAVFESFRQVDMSPTREAGGTGLGLAICRAIVEAHDGAIGVESEPGRGSTFWFTLPVSPRRPGRHGAVEQDVSPR